MGQIPQPMHDIADRDRRSGQQTAHGADEENGDADGFGLPRMWRSLEIGGEAQVEAGNDDEESGPEYLLPSSLEDSSKHTMLPIAPSKPITTYNIATTSPPMN